MSRRRRRGRGRSNQWLARQKRKKNAERDSLYFVAATRRLERQLRRERAFRPTLSQRARDLRARSTIAEQVLYDTLMARNIEFLFQYPIGYWIVDFLLPERRIIVEVDGGYHLDAEQQKKDREREQALIGRGYRILRFKNEEVLKALDATVAKIIAFSRPQLIQGGAAGQQLQQIGACRYCGLRVREDRGQYRNLNGVLHICERMRPKHG